jgi:hypothetical protein
MPKVAYVRFDQQRTWAKLCGRSDDLAAVQRYIGLWSPYMEINLAPVLDDEEATAVGRHIIAANKA